MAIPIYTKYQPFSVRQNMQAGAMGRQQGMMDVRQRALTDVYNDPAMSYGEKANALMPYAPDIAQNMITNAQNQQRLQNQMLTPAMKNFQAGGGVLGDYGGFREYEDRMANLRRPVTNVNTNLPANEKAYLQGHAKSALEGVDAARERARQARGRVASAQQGKRQVIDLGEGAFGTVNAGLLPVYQLLAGFGQLDPDQLRRLGQQEAFAATTQKYVAEYIANSKGSISDAEMRTFAGASPQLSKSYAGNLILLDGMERAARRQMQSEQVYIDAFNNAYRQTGNTVDAQQAADAAWRKWDKANPLFDKQFNARVKAELNRINSGAGVRPAPGNAGAVGTMTPAELNAAEAEFGY